jgi:hypothetical protein
MFFCDASWVGSHHRAGCLLPATALMCTFSILIITRVQSHFCHSVVITIQSYLSHGSWKFLESPGIFFLFFPGPGKSWKTGMVLESP